MEKRILDFHVFKCGPPPQTGQKQQYPSRFLDQVQKQYKGICGNDTLHMFSGAIPNKMGITTDIRPETGADIVAPYNKLPIEDESFGFVLADPPYANFYAKEWDAELPKPKWILKEALRVTEVGGLVLILHLIVIPQYSDLPCIKIAYHPVFCGVNNVCRVLSVFKKASKEEHDAIRESSAKRAERRARKRGSNQHNI